MSILKDNYGFRTGVVVPFIFTIVVVIIVALSLFAWYVLELPTYERQCIDYGTNTGREVRFTRPNWASSTCYVHMSNGWFDIDQINQQNVTQ